MNKDEKIKSTEKLDAVLTWLFDHKGELDCFYGYGLTRTYDKPKQMTLSRREVSNILTKLHSDGYLNLKMQGTESVSANVDVAHYSINFDGEVLLQKGGYTQKIKNENITIRHTKIKDNLLVAFSILAGVSTFGLLILEILNYICGN